jgi:heme/copper-type cytochrome/quinol oxidase subunit 4
MTDTSDMLIFWAVVTARFLIPLTIPRYPLPGVLACLVLDGIDQTIFQLFTNLPLEGYQSYDKSLDIYYLSITYLSTLRNWSNLYAFKLDRFLFYYRLVGVVIFELTQLRPVLLIFPNTFEYFFIFYETVRLKWDPKVLTKSKLITAAALIWIFVKLPQEYWIHVAQLDTTDWIRANPSNALILIAYAAFLLGLAWWLLRDLPPMRPGLEIEAIPVAAASVVSPIPNTVKEQRERLINNQVIEKIVLISLITIIFAQILPGVRSSNLQLATGMAILIIINTALSHWLVRKGRYWRSIAREFIVMSAVNMGLVLLIDYFLPRYDGSINLAATLFFVLLLTLIITLYDRYWQLHTKNHSGGGVSGGEGEENS